jgi:hypothetical protein
MASEIKLRPDIDASFKYYLERSSTHPKYAYGTAYFYEFGYGGAVNENKRLALMHYKTCLELLETRSLTKENNELYRSASNKVFEISKLLFDRIEMLSIKSKGSKEKLDQIIAPAQDGAEELPERCCVIL